MDYPEHGFDAHQPTSPHLTITHQNPQEPRLLKKTTTTTSQHTDYQLLHPNYLIINTMKNSQNSNL